MKPLMKRCFGWSKKSWSIWMSLLVVGFGCLPMQAADDGAPFLLQMWQNQGSFDFYQRSILYGICGLLLLLAAGGIWRGIKEWHARALRQRDEEVFQLINQWTKSLQDEMAERKEAQRALQESQELTLRQERLAAVGQLAAGLAHEFNNILTIIQGHASLLMDNPNMDEDSIKSVTHITEGVERTATLVKQMLAFSRKQVMQLKVVQIKETMSAIGDMLRRLLGAPVVLRIDIAPQLPPITADPEMLQQIIVNLVVNARDALSNGGQVTIRASEIKFAAEDLEGKPDRRPGRFVELSVTDTGSGIDSTIMGHLFEPFFTTKEIGKGAGLGLATVYGMVNQNAGWIEVDSEIGVGTTFNMYFPATANAPEKKSPNTEPPRACGGRENILVVEDEAVLRDLVREILEAHGYHVLDAASGWEALQVWEKHAKNVDLLLTDMSMPDGMSGRDLAAKLQEDNPRLPVIFSSGYTHEALEDKAEAGQGQTFLSKPYHPADLAQTVRAALDKAARGQTSMASPKPSLRP